MSLATRNEMGKSPRLNVTNVTKIAREAARSTSRNLRVMGVALGDRDGDYAEVIIDLEECHSEPCRISIGIFRSASPETLRDEIVKHLQRHLREHATS
jgi:hypothetical protein